MIEVKKISGIHNYCNRWCERCSFTNRCEVAARQIGMKEDDNTSEKDVWDSVQTHLEEAFELLKDMLKEMEVGLESFEVSESLNIPDQTKAPNKKPAPNQDLQAINASAKEYGMKASQWFSEHTELLEGKELELNRLLEIGAKDIVREAHLIRDAITVIRWNMFLIGAKLNRAISNRYDDLFPDENTIQNDSNGSAKVALIAIEDSLAAWKIILNKIPELSDESLDLLANLSRIKRMSEEAFPDARKFKRPGFDDDLSTK